MSGTEIEINVESAKEAEPTPAEKAAKKAEKKAELDALFGALKKMLDGKSGLTGMELELAKAEITKKIAECLDPEDY